MLCSMLNSKIGFMFSAINICSVSNVVLHAKIYNCIFNSRHKYIFFIEYLNDGIGKIVVSKVLAQDMTEKSTCYTSSILNQIGIVSRIFSFELKHF